MVPSPLSTTFPALTSSTVTLDVPIETPAESVSSAGCLFDEGGRPQTFGLNIPLSIPGTIPLSIAFAEPPTRRLPSLICKFSSPMKA